MLKRRPRSSFERPEQLATSADELVGRYETLTGDARIAFARHQRLLLEECLRQNGLAPAEMQDLADEVAGGLERVDAIEEAIVIRRRLLALALEHVGDEHEASLGHMENLATDLSWLEQYESSIELLDHVWAVRCRDLGTRNELTLQTQRDLATTMVRGGQFHRAIELDEDLFEHYRDTLGAEHERTVDAAEQTERARQWATKGPE